MGTQWLASHLAHPRAAAVSAFVGVGVLGGLKTYSAFQVHVFAAVARDAWGMAALIVVVTVLGCLAAGGVALAIAR